MEDGLDASHCTFMLMSSSLLLFLVCAWESKFGMEDGTLQMHLHMMSGINLRSTKFVVVGADWNVRAWAKLCDGLELLEPTGPQDAHHSQ